VTACLFYHRPGLLSTPFQNFFQSFFCGSPPEDSSPRQLPYSITSDQHCQGFFEDFLRFIHFAHFPLGGQGFPLSVCPNYPAIPSSQSVIGAHLTMK